MKTYPPCVIDGRPCLDNGLLCLACWADLRRDLVDIRDELARWLDITYARLSKLGEESIGIVIRGSGTGLGFNDRAGAVSRALAGELGRAVDAVLARTKVSGPRSRDIPTLAAWLVDHHRPVRDDPGVARLHRRVRELVGQAERVIDRRPPRVYLGQCGAPLTDVAARCDADIYARDDEDWVKCVCGMLWQVEHRREVLLDAVGEQLATAVEVCRALATYADVELKVDRLYKWAERGQIEQHPPRECETAPRYRIDDVREVLDAMTRKAGR